MYKIIGADGQQYGPVSAEQIRRWVTENRARGETLLQPEGSQEWKPLSSFPEFAADLASAPPPISNVPPPVAPFQRAGTDRASTKVPAGVCGILLGGLGVHKFILGYTTEGILEIVITICTCGAGHVIGLIEGIIYLTKSDEEFVRTYIQGRKTWF